MQTAASHLQTTQQPCLAICHQHRWHHRRQSSLYQGKPCSLLYEKTNQRFRKVLLGAAISCTSCPQGQCSVATKQLLYSTSSVTIYNVMARESQHSLLAKSRLISRPLPRNPVLLFVHLGSISHTHSDAICCQGTQCWATVLESQRTQICRTTVTISIRTTLLNLVSAVNRHAVLSVDEVCKSRDLQVTTDAVRGPGSRQADSPASVSCQQNCSSKWLSCCMLPRCPTPPSDTP